MSSNKLSFKKKFKVRLKKTVYTCLEGFVWGSILKVYIFFYILKILKAAIYVKKGKRYPRKIKITISSVSRNKTRNGFSIHISPVRRK